MSYIKPIGVDENSGTTTIIALPIINQHIVNNDSLNGNELPEEQSYWGMNQICEMIV